MSDNFQDQHGNWLAADEVAGQKSKVQRVKVGHGADDSYQDVSFAAPLPVTVVGAGGQQSLMLITANVAAGAQSVFGGDYVFLVTGTFNGATVQLQFLGPDGTTWQNIGTAKTSPDTTGGQGVGLGSNASVRATITNGTPANLNASLSRLPA